MRLIILFCLIFAFPYTAQAGLEIHDFYNSGSDFSFQDFAIIAGVTTAVIAAVAGVVLLVSPPAGLALIGCSAVTIGGVIGAVLIGSALTFSTDLVIDYTYHYGKS